MKRILTFGNGYRTFPSYWVRDSQLRHLTAHADVVGANIAALKLYLAIAACSDYRQPGTATISYSDVASLTGLSREMVSTGIKTLINAGLVSVVHGYRNQYTLAPDPAGEDARFAKLPLRVVAGYLEGSSNRGAFRLAALKIYIVLLAFRDNAKSETRIGHEKLRDYTGIQPNQVKQGISELLAHRVIHVDTDSDDLWKQPHVYSLLGDFRLLNSAAPRAESSSSEVPF